MAIVESKDKAPSLLGLSLQAAFADVSRPEEREKVRTAQAFMLAAARGDRARQEHLLDYFGTLLKDPGKAPGVN